MSLSNWFHDRSQHGRGRESYLQHNDGEEDIESVTTIMSARSGYMLRRPMLVRSSLANGHSFAFSRPDILLHSHATIALLPIPLNVLSSQAHYKKVGTSLSSADLCRLHADAG